jgi:hypothetical protein
MTDADKQVCDDWAEPDAALIRASGATDHHPAGGCEHVDYGMKAAHSWSVLEIRRQSAPVGGLDERYMAS